MSLSDIMAPVLARQRNEVLKDAWGHLAPEKDIRYKGKIYIFVSPFNKGGGFDFEFEGLDSSPWLYDAIQEYLNDWNFPYNGLWEFDCTVRNYKITGRPKLLLKTSDISEPCRTTGVRLRGDDDKFNGWVLRTIYTLKLNGKPKRFSKTNISVEIKKVYDQRIFDLHHK